MKGFGYIYSPWTDTFGSPWRTKQNIEFYRLQVCILSRKVWWAVWSGNFCQKLGYFTDQNWPKVWPHENEFWLFWNIKVNFTNK